MGAGIEVAGALRAAVGAGLWAHPVLPTMATRMVASKTRIGGSKEPFGPKINHILHHERVPV